MNKESISGTLIASHVHMNPIIDRMVIALTEEIRTLSHNGETAAKHCDELGGIVTSLGDDMAEVRNLSTVYRQRSDSLRRKLNELKTLVNLP